MRAYQLTLNFYSPLLIHHPPMLDGIVAYCLEHKLNQLAGYFVRNLGLDKSMLSFPKLMSNYFASIDDINLVSELRLGPCFEFLDYSTKRFENKFSDLVDFDKAKHRVNVQGLWSGSRKTPLRCIAVNYANWYFIGNGEGIQSLLQDHIIGIGKRADSGWGWIDKIKLSGSQLSKMDILRLRPIPIDMANKYGITGQRKICAYKIPYWDRVNVVECVVPNASV